MTESILQQLQNIRSLFADAAPTDKETIDRYAWIIVKALNSECADLGSTTCRQLLAEYMKLDVEKPSRLHSAILAAAVKVAMTWSDFHFVAFLKMWGIGNMRQEDFERQPNPTPGAMPPVFPSLAERVGRAYLHAQLLRPEETLSQEELSTLSPAIHLSGMIRQFLVIRIKQATGKDGRKLFFVELVSKEGVIVECESHTLQPHPLRPLPEGKRHYVNIGQVYDVVVASSATATGLSSDALSKITVREAYLSAKPATDYFETVTGYVEHIDAEHGHIHVFDHLSRHFVASVQRFNNPKEGDFVRFIPVTPLNSRFKSAIITGRAGTPAPSLDGLVRTVRITSINNEKQYAAWELTDGSSPITEQLSSLQLSQGETSPSFKSGFMNLSMFSGTIPAVGSTINAVIFLKRGKDGQKRPKVAAITAG